MARSTPKPAPTTRAKSARRAEALAQLKREQARQRRRSRLVMATAAVGGVALVAAAVVAVGLRSGGGPSEATTTADPTVVAAVTGVPAATFDAVGVGTAKGLPSSAASASGEAPPPLTADGKPRMLYLGAEYCPFCAAQRWAVVAALSRFGTFTGLGQTASAHDDVFPDTPTLSFHGSSYASKYLAFTGVEQTGNQRQGNSYEPLDTLSDADAQLVDTYNKPPYVAGSGGSIPFVDIGNEYFTSGASYSPDLFAGLSRSEIVKAMQDPDSKIGRAVDGAANGYAAAICDVTKQQPAAVCTSPGVTAAAKALAGS